MAKSNVWARFQALLPDRSYQVVTVVSVGTNGTSVVQSDAGAQWTVIGDSVAASSRALVQEGRIVGAASDLPTYYVSV